MKNRFTLGGEKGRNTMRSLTNEAAKEAKEHFRIGRFFLVEAMEGYFKIATDPEQWNMSCEGGKKFAYVYLREGLKLLKFEEALYLLSYGYEPAYARFLEDLKGRKKEENGKRKEGNGFG